MKDKARVTRHFQIWDQSKLDPHNDNGIRFESVDVPRIRSMKKYFSILDHLSLDAFSHNSNYSKLETAFQRLPDLDRKRCALVHHITFSYLGQFFDDDESGRHRIVAKLELFRPKKYFDEVTFKGWESFLKDYVQTCRNPAVRSRCLIALLLAGSPKGRTKEFIAKVHAAAWQEARHFLKFVGYGPKQRGMQAFAGAAYILAKFYNAVESNAELEQTIRWICHEGSAENVMLEEIGRLILLFSSTDHLKVSKETAARFCRQLNERVMLAALRSDTNWLQPLADLSFEIAVAYGAREQADAQKVRVDTLLVQLGKEVGGPVGLRILEDLIAKNPQGVAALSREEFVRQKRETNRQMQKYMKPQGGYSITVDPRKSVVLKAIQEETDFLEKVLLMTHFPGLIPTQTEIDEFLVDMAREAPLMSMIGVETHQGDRNSGGTTEDAEFRGKEALLNHLFLPRFLPQVLPALGDLVVEEGNSIQLISLIKESPGWSPDSERQFDAAFNSLKTNKSVECLFTLIAFFEGYIRRSLDSVGIPIDNERGATANVIHGKLLDSLIAKYSAAAQWDEVDTRLLKLVLSDEGAGWNLRNNAYHGLLLDKQIDMIKASVVFFFFLRVVGEMSYHARQSAAQSTQS